MSRAAIKEMLGTLDNRFKRIFDLHKDKTSDDSALLQEEIILGRLAEYKLQKPENKDLKDGDKIFKMREDFSDKDFVEKTKKK